MSFDPVYIPVDEEAVLSIRATGPSDPWHRVAVIGLWAKAQTTRKRWPDAAVVGPLRTKSGIDLLVRNLLANPQIDVLVVDGPTGGPIGEDTQNALARLWGGAWGPQPGERFELLAEDLQGSGPNGIWEDVTRMLEQVRIVWVNRGEDPVEVRRKIDVALLISQDAPKRRVLRLPPPPPKAEAPAPHGDPGERVAGETLADVWPLALHRAMRFGREVPTQYGLTREFWNLVSVVRDPKASIEELKTCPVCITGPCQDTNSLDSPCPCVSFGPTPDRPPHPVLGLTFEQVERYTRESLMGAVAPEGQAYSYGSRMRGTPWRDSRLEDDGHERVDSDHRGTSQWIVDHHAARGTPITGFCWASRAEDGSGSFKMVDGRCEGCGWFPPLDQFAAVKQLLVSSPGTRAAYLTPWRPDRDSGKESGCPCLVGVTFRATGGCPPPTPDKPDGSPGECPVCGVEVGSSEQRCKFDLHMAVTFRSHDLAQAFGLNLAGCCLWLVELARDLGMAVGTLTCVSQSAHVYDRDWKRANDVIDKIRWPALRWDPRSSWRVEKVEDPWEPAVGDKSVDSHGAHYEIVAMTPDLNRPYQVVGNGNTASPFSLGRGALVGHGFHAAKAKPRLRATAFTPGPTSDGKVIAVIEAPTPGALRLQIERSGLVTEIGAALYLGTEIERVGRTL